MINFTFTLNEKSAISIRVHDFARLENEAVLISAVGPKSACEAVAAMLKSGKHVSIKDRSSRTLSESHCGYKTWVAHLGMDTYHLLAVTRDEQVLTGNTPDHLWNALRGEQYTTPIIKAWTPAIMRRLIELKLLIELAGFGRKVSWLKAKDEQLDGIVSSMVQKGELVIA